MHRMRIQKRAYWQQLLIVALLANPVGGFAYSLLGPYADWMDVQKGYRLSGDIGGPMNIGEGYRWNVPVVTYGFDASFLDYFGSSGVAAVEAAIGILNALPPVSSIDLTNYPQQISRVNYSAQACHLLDVKSATVLLLLEQMGLADPERYIFTIRDFQQYGTGTNFAFTVIERNFDAATAQPSTYLNGTLFSYYIQRWATLPSPTNVFCTTQPFIVDPNQSFAQPAASWMGLNYGFYLSGLSRDDVGGLRYLMNGNQVHYESLPPDVHAAVTETNGYVQMAYRPGIEKVTFVRHPFGFLSGAFPPFTNRWTDVYFDYDEPVYQEVERVIARPDILFSASDLGAGPILTRTGTTNWANNAAVYGRIGGAGPGVIQPPISLTYNTAGPFYINSFDPSQHLSNLDQATASSGFYWGSFDGSTNESIVYPVGQVVFQPTQVRFRLLANGATNDFRWSLTGGAYGRFSFQTATSLTGWTTLTTLTNSGDVFSYQFQAATNEARRFFRTIQQL
jgi:hypothetical protein